jgi:hypothetical protein
LKPIYNGAATRWCNQGGKHPDGGSFSGPVWAKKAKNFAIMHIQGQILNRNQIPKFF